MSKFISTGFGEAMDDAWLWFKFASVPTKIAAVIMTLFALGIIGIFVWGTVVEPVAGLIVLAGGALFVSFSILIESGDIADYERKQSLKEKAHRQAHPRPVLHDGCTRCYADKDARGPRRYLGGRKDWTEEEIETW